MKIVSQSLIKNEERWVWFALRSVIDWVDEVLVWDSGSADRTIEIVKSLGREKVKLKSVTVTSAEEHTQRRQEMLMATSADWFIIVDGDEVWWQDSISRLVEAIYAHPKARAIVSPFYNAVGDIWHYQDPSQISYRIHHWHGGYTIRAINRRIPGLHVDHPHGRQEYQTGAGVALQNLPLSQLVFVDAPYLHLTHLYRSRPGIDKSTLKRAFKYRFDLGNKFLPRVYPPEVFYFPRPAFVPDPLTTRGMAYEIVALGAGGARGVKRAWFPHLKSGY